MSSHPASAAYPLVLGVLGRSRRTEADPAWASALARDSAARLAEPATLRRSGPGWALLATDAPLLEAGRRGVTWGRYVAATRRPRHWRDAADELGLAGLWTEGRAVRLHADALGVQDVFVREVDGALYFSNRIAPLRDLGGTLDEDTDAWGAALGFGGFVGRSTPFRQIRRLLAGESVVCDDDGPRLVGPDSGWLGDPVAGVGPAEIRRAFEDALPRRWPRRARTITLSGGWDSRLIALGMRARKALPNRAWTVHHDDGSADDVLIAADLAERLALEHIVAETRPHAWVRRRREVLDRVEHLTWLHTWLEPMARRVRADGRPLLDGLGGDVLLRASSSDPEGVDPTDRDSVLAAQWDQLTRGRMELSETLDPDLAAHWLGTSRALMAEAGDAVAGHPSELVLRTLTVRTNRVTGLSPMRLFAPDIPVTLPFMTTSFVRTAASVPVDRVVDRDHYRAVLAEFDPVIGALPSTNDGIPRTRLGRPLAATNHALDTVADVVENDPAVLACLHPALRDGLARRDRPTLRRAATVLRWAAAYADWREKTAMVRSHGSGPVVGRA